MSGNTFKDTEYLAMQAWAKLVNKGKAPTYVADGVPVRDTSSQPKLQ